MRTIKALLLCCALSGCGLSQNLRAESGYQVQAVDNKTFKISLEINSPEEGQSARDYFARRAERVAEEKGCIGYEIIHLNSYNNKTTEHNDDEIRVRQWMVVSGTIHCHG